MHRPFSMNIKYDQTFLAYIDFLGFENLVSKRDPEYIKKILLLSKECSKNNGRYEYEINEIFDSVWFSDLYIRTINLDKHKNLSQRDFLFYEILVLTAYQINAIIQYGVLMRGSVHIGMFYSDYSNKIYFGPALIDAHNDERKKVKFSRITIDKSVIEFYTNPPDWYKSIKEKTDKENDSLTLKNLICLDDDGLYFIDYIGYHLSFGVSNLNNDDNDFLIIHKKLINDELKHNDRIEKYYWLKNYFNRSLLKYKDYLKNFGIDIIERGYFID